jgi:hypothetical protein
MHEIICHLNLILKQKTYFSVADSRTQIDYGCGSFKNQHTIYFESKLWDADKVLLLMGQMQTLGKAIGILTAMMCAANKNWRDDNYVQVWRSTAKYALLEKQIATIWE